MNRLKKQIGILLSIAVILLLTLNFKNCISGTQEGIRLCMQVLIPALFPFFVFSAYLSSMINPKNFHYIESLLHIKSGTGSYLLLGLLGGYPSGAQLIADAYDRNTIDEETANHLLFFCNNAGPAFILGLSASLFSSVAAGWLLWLIHILSAILAGFLLHDNNSKDTKLAENTAITLPAALKKSMFAMSYICGWVILFRTLLAGIMSLLSSDTPQWFNIIFTGILELSNGALSLQSISSESTRFILFSIFLGFGGICVMMQTASIIGKLNIKYFITGKILHGLISMIFAIIISKFLYSQVFHLLDAGMITGAVFVCMIIISILNKRKKCCIINKEKHLLNRFPT